MVPAAADLTSEVAATLRYFIEQEDIAFDALEVAAADVAVAAPFTEATGEQPRAMVYPAGLKPWRILISCAEKHENVFDSGWSVERQTVAGASVIVGRPPTARDKTWNDLSAELSAGKAATRIPGIVKGLVANLAVLGTLLGGFGLYKSVADNLGDLAPLVAIPVMFAALSVACGLVASRPATGSLDLGNLRAVKDWYEPLLARRLAWISAAFVLFILSLLTVPLLLLLDQDLDEHRNVPEISASWTLGEEGKASIVTKVKVAEVPDGGRLVVTADGTDADGSKRLLSAKETAPQSRAATVSATLPVTSTTFTEITLDASVQNEDREELGRQELSLLPGGAKAATETAQTAPDDDEVEGWVVLVVAALAGVVGVALLVPAAVTRGPKKAPAALAAGGVALILGAAAGLSAAVLGLERDWLVELGLLAATITFALLMVVPPLRRRLGA